MTLSTSKVRFIISFLFLIISSSAFSSPKIRVEGRHFMTADGQEIVLKGVNAFGSSKLPPFIRESDALAFPLVKALGFDHVRLLFNWEAFEPIRGAYNHEYLAAYDHLVKKAGEAGLYVVIDFHQDAYSRYLSGGCGEGFPLWATPPNIRPRQPANGEPCKLWALYAIIDVSTHRAWNSFYEDYYDVKTAYFAMIRQVVSHFKTRDNVIGYDLLNEPWGFEASQMSVFYEQAASVVTSVDPTALIFFEPHPTTAFSWGGQTKLRRPAFKNAVYAPHLYDFNVIARGYWNGSMDSPRKTLQRHIDKATEWNIPLYIGEWGAPATVPHVKTFVENMWFLLLGNGVSSAQWNITPSWNPVTKDGFNLEDLSIIDDHGQPRENYVLPQR